MSRRLCRQCGAPLGIDDDRCQTCGAANPVPLPWYMPFLGLAIVVLLVLLLVDLDDVSRLVEAGWTALHGG